MSTNCHAQSVTLTNVNAKSTTWSEDSCSTTSKWHQSVALVWYDCLIRTEMMALTLLLRLDFRPNGNHHHNKGMNSQSSIMMMVPFAL